MLITDDGGGVAQSLADVLVAEGVHASVMGDAIALDHLPESDVVSLVCLDGLRPTATIDDAVEINHRVFRTARALARSSATVNAMVTVSNLGGTFGVDGGGEPELGWSGGITGLTRTAALEWPATTVRAIDIEHAGQPAEALARLIANELAVGGSEPEVGLKVDGSRVTLTTVETPVTAGSTPLGAPDVVVVSGGGRGVTATTMIELARSSGATFVLLGRSVPTEEPPNCIGVENGAALKQVLLTDAQAKRTPITPKELSTRASQVEAGREIRATIAAIKEAGGRAHYRAVDITDRAAVASAFAAIRREIGPITGVVHGAGVLADKLIADQTDDAFHRVFSTKVDGLRALLEATDADQLKVLCLFSSVAARTGNRGQVAYAMANEVLNQVARCEQARRGGSCVVKALGWGPWDGGMVTPALKKHFEEMGTSLIAPAAGAQALVAELASPSRDQVDIVLGGGVLGGGVLGGGVLGGGGHREGVVER